MCINHTQFLGNPTLGSFTRVDGWKHAVGLGSRDDALQRLTVIKASARFSDQYLKFTILAAFTIMAPNCVHTARQVACPPRLNLHARSCALQHSDSSM